MVSRCVKKFFGGEGKGGECVCGGGWINYYMAELLQSEQYEFEFEK